MSVTLSTSNRVATITLNRPDSYNAFDSASLESFKQVLDQVQQDKTVRAIIITGAGKAFCAGADLKELGTGDIASNIEQILVNGFNPVVTKLRTVEKPVIAALNGVAAGAGASIALAADYRIASEKATFVFAAFTRIGLVPDAGSTHFLQRLVGPAKAFEYFALTDVNNKMSANMALGAGIVNRVISHDNLEQIALTTAERFAAMPTRAVGMMKQALNYAAEHTLEESLVYEAQLQAKAAATRDFQEGVAAFNDKREPDFQGE